MNWDDLVYVMVFLVLAFIPGAKKQQTAKPKTQNTEDDARCLEEARKKIEMLKRQRRTSETEIQALSSQEKPTVEDLLWVSSTSGLATPIGLVRSEIEQPYMCIQPMSQPKLRTRIKKSIRLRQWIMGQVVLKRKFDARY
ncbi:MAG: hypothetical protein LBB19_00800 [Puniceicoccales bacterium]|jgi:hypothetical protein|nr:hypothetical protein [Puniceicoccales bacterium]